MTTSEQATGELEELLEYIKTDRGFDFTGYKRPSLTRRIGKRMQERGVSSYAEYRALLEDTPEEFVDLFNTILINVTAFFRDEVAWDYLRGEIVPRILGQRDGEERLRVWSTGCASGEEAYSLAMVLAEALGEDAFRHRVKIYATDIDDDALNHGRHAVYTAKHLEAVPADLRDRYFEPSDRGFVFRADLRRSVVFGRHDLVGDPPISRIDLLVSRNTLMYFTTATQERILANFHFALRDDGYLFLGKSEALAARINLFAAIDIKKRVFTKVPKRPFIRAEGAAGTAGDSLSQLASDAMIRDAGFEAVSVAQIVVGKDGRLALANLQARVFFGLTHGDIGQPLKDLEISFRPVELRSRIEQIYNERHAISLRDVEWKVGSEDRFLDIQMTPLVAERGKLIGVGVTFTEVTRYRRLQVALQDSKRELETAYEELQSTVEEVETTNEELQSTVEELETTNEELQSTNEELETMNEELQSTNEELETMNDELHTRTVDLDESARFLEAILGSLDAGVVVVNEQLEVDAWNRGARELWGLDAEEVIGRNFLKLDIGLPVEQLRTPVRSVLAGKDEAPDLILSSVNRRGRHIRCHVAVTPLTRPGGSVRGAILMMQAVAEESS